MIVGLNIIQRMLTFQVVFLRSALLRDSDANIPCGWEDDRRQTLLLLRRHPQLPTVS